MKQSIYSLLILVILTVTSCSSDTPLGPDDITEFREVYHYEISDSVVSADTHEITLNMTGENLPKDWTIWDFKLWNGKKIPDNIDQYTMNWERPTDKDVFYSDDKVGVDWITFEKQLTSTSPVLKIQVKQNDSDEARGAMLVFANRDGVIVNYGAVMIVQKPKP